MYQLFTGKIILFGEYSIIAGSKALVMPLKLFSGKLTIPESKLRDNQEAEWSAKELRGFLKFLASKQNKEELSVKLDIERLGMDLDNGLYFRSQIPGQYGVGSSSALVAAVYDAYALDKIRRGNQNRNKLSRLRDVFSEMESYFHGTSSGIDPLCSYMGENILIDGRDIIPVGNFELASDAGLFLFDSGLRGETGSLVSDFKYRMANDANFAGMVRNDLNLLVQRGIESLRIDREKGLKDTGLENKEIKDVFRDISEFQLLNFSSMIPESVKKVWENGLDTDAYFVKLCGSGGGGFFLAFTDHLENTRDKFRQEGMNILPLDL